MIKCPKCGEKQGYVLRTDYQQKWNQIRRLRACRPCGHTFNTYENVDDEGVEG